MYKMLLRQKIFQKICKYFSKKIFFGLPFKNKGGRMKIHSRKCIRIKNFISKKCRISKSIFCNSNNQTSSISFQLIFFLQTAMLTVFASSVETKRTKLKRKRGEKENENKKYADSVVEKRQP